jgi:hypothetical protein
MNDLETPPPNARLLGMSLNTVNDADFIDLNDSFPDIDIISTPFTKTETVLFPVDLADIDHPLGFSYKLCSRLHRPFIDSIIRSPSPRQSLRAFRNKFLGAFTTIVNAQPVFTCNDINNAIQSLRALREPPTHIELILAPERLTDLNDHALPPLHLRQVDLDNIARLENSIPSNPYSLLLVNRLQTDGMIPEERALPKLTRHWLKKLPNWHVWDEAFDAQLDAHLRDGAFGQPFFVRKV